jgi:hypothetical protein
MCWIMLIVFLALGEIRQDKGLLYAGIVMMYLYQASFDPLHVRKGNKFNILNRLHLLLAGFQFPGSILLVNFPQPLKMTDLIPNLA